MTDKNILQMIGWRRIELHDFSALVFGRIRKWCHGSEQEKIAINVELEILRNKGVIVSSIHEEGEYVSGIFTR